MDQLTEADLKAARRFEGARSSSGNVAGTRVGEASRA